MATPCNTPLTDPPFQTYRDPLTGEWLITHRNTQSSKVIDLATKRHQRVSQNFLPARTIER